MRTVILGMLILVIVNLNDPRNSHVIVHAYNQVLVMVVVISSLCCQ